MSKHGFALLGLDHWYAAFAVADAVRRSERVPVAGVADGRANLAACLSFYAARSGALHR